MSESKVQIQRESSMGIQEVVSIRCNSNVSLEQYEAAVKKFAEAHKNCQFTQNKMSVFGNGDRSTFFNFDGKNNNHVNFDVDLN
jgi:hypothetical protein